MNMESSGTINEAAAPVRDRRGVNIALWILQVLLALLFVFAGIMKLRMPAETLAQQTHLPGVLMQAVSVCELLGGLGLVVPGLVGRWRFLTPLAAAGLVVIMIGAVVVTVMTVSIPMAVFPLVVGLLCALVAYARRGWR